MNIDNIINEIMQFYSWICIKTGLSSRQLVIIALVVLALLLLFLRYLRKINKRKKHLIKSADRPEVIGLKLSERESKPLTQENVKNQKAVFFQKEHKDESNKSWGQTTKKWRQLREKNMQLKHDVNIQERSQKHLKVVITELKDANEQLHLEIKKHIKIEKELRQQIDELTRASLAQVQKEMNKKEDSPENEQDVEVRQPIQRSSIIRQGKQEESLKNSKNTTQKWDSQRFVDEKSQQEKSESQHVNNYTLEKTQAQDTDQVEGTEIENSVPLDIKELKVIADLANRLQERSQQRQNEQP